MKITNSREVRRAKLSAPGARRIIYLTISPRRPNQRAGFDFEIAAGKIPKPLSERVTPDHVDLETLFVFVSR